MPKKISIHALVKRATLTSASLCLAKVYFNPRPREEGDVCNCHSVTSDSIISIHALVKRATYGSYTTARTHGNFNPRPREEGDLAKNKNISEKANFNPRPREEGDVITPIRCRSLLKFQSTPS